MVRAWNTPPGLQISHLALPPSGSLKNGGIVMSPRTSIFSRVAASSRSGLSPDGRLVEISELKDHPFMLGSQFHPEFKSRPDNPHPLFLAFVQKAIEEQKRREE